MWAERGEEKDLVVVGREGELSEKCEWEKKKTRQKERKREREGGREREREKARKHVGKAERHSSTFLPHSYLHVSTNTVRDRVRMQSNCA